MTHKQIFNKICSLVNKYCFNDKFVVNIWFCNQNHQINKDYIGDFNISLDVVYYLNGKRVNGFSYNHYIHDCMDKLEDKLKEFVEGCSKISSVKE